MPRNNYTAIKDYIVVQEDHVFKLIITDPVEGYHICYSDEIRTESYTSGDLGKIEKLSLSYNQELLAVYNKEGTIIILPIELNDEYDRIETGIQGASSIVWCENCLPLLINDDKLYLVGPGHKNL